MQYTVSQAGGQCSFSIADGGRRPHLKVDPEGNPKEEIVYARAREGVRPQAGYWRGWKKEGMTSRAAEGAAWHRRRSQSWSQIIGGGGYQLGTSRWVKAESNYLRNGV